MRTASARAAAIGTIALWLGSLAAACAQGTEETSAKNAPHGFAGDAATDATEDVSSKPDGSTEGSSGDAGGSDGGGGAPGDGAPEATTDGSGGAPDADTDGPKLGCASDAFCPGNAPKCDPATHACVGCLSNADCGNPSDHCVLSTHTCGSACGATSECVASLCQACLGGACGDGCTGGAVCSGGTCACPGGTKLCNGACVAAGSCCTDSDCPGMLACPSPGGSCACRTSPARAPIYRSSNGTYLLSVDPNEGPNAGYADLGVTFYDYPGACAWGLVPLYRLYGGYEHFYTRDPAERDAYVNSGWSEEGDVGCVDVQNECGTLALYRLVDFNSGLHVYTTDQAEHDTWVSYGYYDEGAIAWVWAGP